MVFKGPRSIWPSLVTNIYIKCTHTYTCTSTHVYTFIISLSSLTTLSLLLVQWILIGTKVDDF